MSERLNPQGVQVEQLQGAVELEDLTTTTCGATEEAALERGNIGIFNRRYVTKRVPRSVRPPAHPGPGQKLPPKLGETAASGSERFREINDWEHYLTDQGYRVRQALPQRQQGGAAPAVPDPDRRARDQNWKFSPNDARERAYWDDYQKAFSEMLRTPSTSWAPWYVIPARRQAVRSGRRRRGRARAAHPDRDRPAVPEGLDRRPGDALQGTKVRAMGQAPDGAAADPIGG